LDWFKCSAEPAPQNQFARKPHKERAMSSDKQHDDDATAPVPWMQQLLDNPFLLLFLGVFVPMVLYTAWGVFDILTLPMGK
jgi:hypothetical protein